MDASLLQKTPLTQQQDQAVSEALQFISQITNTAKSLGYRVIISGGYAVDGALGMITRPHDDIDIQIYGQKPATDAVKQIVETLDPTLLPKLTDKGRQEFWHYFHLQLEGSLAEFYYIQLLTDPFAPEKVVVKADGTQSPSHAFNTSISLFEGHFYEIQHPRVELADKLYKRNIRQDEVKSKHDQDIANLRLITNSKQVEDELELMKSR